jgi:hypothetical protein
MVMELDLSVCAFHRSETETSCKPLHVYIKLLSKNEHSHVQIVLLLKHKEFREIIQVIN